jgi:hypothetical protein
LIAQCYGLLAQGLAPATHRVYAAGQRSYFRFAAAFGFPRFPASEWHLMLFATWLYYNNGLAPSSITTYIAAVRSLHIDLGAVDPTRGASRLARLLRGIRRARASPRPLRLPITNNVMHLLCTALSSPSFDHVMFWAACCTAFFGFLRVSELTCPGPFIPSRHLALEDLQFVSTGHFRLRLKSSKTDPFGEGCTVLLGPSGGTVCPVKALLRYLAIRGSLPGPLFICNNGSPLKPTVVNSWLRSILHSAGLAGNYSSHSFRIGAATSAAVSGMPDHLIKTLGRWSSDAYLRYIRTPPEVLLQSARHLV